MNGHANPSFSWNGGFRYTNVTIPAGATIESATTDIYVITNDDPNLNIYAEAVDNAVNFSTDADVTDRATTTASAQWTDTAIGTGFITSPDFTAVIQEIVDRGGWASGQSIVLLLKGRNDALGLFRSRTWDDTTGGQGTSAAKLDVQFCA